MPVLVNLDAVTVTRGTTMLLDAVSLGVASGDRVGVVGRNGAGKTTLLHTLAGIAAPQGGRVTHVNGLRVGMLSQADTLDPAASVADLLAGPGRDGATDWRRDAAKRAVVDGLGLAGQLDRSVATLSGGERRRAALGVLLASEVDLLVLDEPTNHLDVEVVAWLASYLAAWPSGRALVAVTHDRWFLDEVATTTWEVHDAQVDSYAGGYSAYALARAERSRQAASEQGRRANLLRKELAWLRRGAPARTSKPRYRVEAANALIAAEPPPRDNAGLQRFAAARLGRQVLDLEEGWLSLGGRPLLAEVTWRLAAGERVGLVGVNGAGKTTLLRVLAGEQPLDRGRLRTGQTVRLGHLSQDAGGLPASSRVLEAVQEVARVLTVGAEELTAGQLLERFGFPANRHWTPVGELSGGERRRLQLLRLLMAAPNVLLLDEPTNDLDVDTLIALEDLLDSWAGTLVVVSHDRWFLERVCDTTRALLGDASLAALPGGVEQYLAGRRSAPPPAAPAPPSGPTAGPAPGAEARAARKEMARLERTMARLERAEQQLHQELAACATDYERVASLDLRLRALAAERDEAEHAWLAAAESA